MPEQIPTFKPPTPDTRVNAEAFGLPENPKNDLLPAPEIPTVAPTHVELGGVAILGGMKPSEGSNVEEEHSLEREFANLPTKWETDVKHWNHVFASDVPESGILTKTHAAVIPAGSDKLSAGNFRRIMKDGGEYTDLGDVEVKQSKFGNVVNVEAFSYVTWPYIERGGTKIMEDLGFEFDTKTGKVKYVPTPHTFQAAAKLQGVDVELMPDEGIIPPRPFVTAYSQRKYPAATGDSRIYEHDTQDDHITALVLGGDLLKDALADSASKALAEGDEAVSAATGRIDDYTNLLRKATANVTTTDPEQLRGAISVGIKLGISQEKTLEILDFSAKRAEEKYGIDGQGLKASVSEVKQHGLPQRDTRSLEEAFAELAAASMNKTS